MLSIMLGDFLNSILILFLKKTNKQKQQLLSYLIINNKTTSTGCVDQDPGLAYLEGAINKAAPRAKPPIAQ